MGDNKMTSGGLEVRRFNQGFIAPHPSIRKDAVDVDKYLEGRQVYNAEYLGSVVPSHHNPQTWYEVAGWYWHVAVRTLVGLVTSLLGLLSGAAWPQGGDPRASERVLSQRMAFFAAAGQAVGAAGALGNAMKSWVLARPDNGWVHTLLAEAECTRTHSGILLTVAKPSLLSRLVLLAIQAQVFMQYYVIYTLLPGVAHAYSAYRAEEQVFNYSEAARLTERGTLHAWKGLPAPELARAYYALPVGATFHDSLLRMRADEACLNHMNLVFAGLVPCNRNPFIRATAAAS